MIEYTLVEHGGDATAFPLELLIFLFPLALMAFVTYTYFTKYANMEEVIENEEL